MQLQLSIRSSDKVFCRALQEVLEQEGFLIADNASFALQDSREQQSGMESPGIAIGFHEGALQPPFRLEELLNRLQSIVAKPEQAAEVLTLDENCHYVAQDRRISCLDTPHTVQLTEKEAQLLDSLLAAGSAGCTREFLLKTVWGYNEGADTHTLETHMYRLRAKLREVTENELIVTTADGYVFQLPK